MSISPNRDDREYGKFRGTAAGPAVAVTNADGSPISAGGGGGTSMVDDAPFTTAASSVTPIGAILDDSLPDAVDEGDVGAVRMTPTRALHTTLRDGQGDSAMDDANNAVRVNVVAGGAGGGAAQTQVRNAADTG